MHPRCPRCPIPPGARCLGESHRRLCELRDPDHPDHDPAYLKPLRGEGGPASVDGEQEARPRPRRRPAFTEAERLRNRRFAAMHRCPARSRIAGRCGDCVGACAERGGEAVAAAVCLECPRTLEG